MCIYAVHIWMGTKLVVARDSRCYRYISWCVVCCVCAFLFGMSFSVVVVVIVVWGVYHVYTFLYIYMRAHGMCDQTSSHARQSQSNDQKTATKTIWKRETKIGMNNACHSIFSFDSRSISALLYKRMYANHKLQSIDLVFFGKFFAHTHTLKFLF